MILETFADAIRDRVVTFITDNKNVEAAFLSRHSGCPITADVWRAFTAQQIARRCHVLAEHTPRAQNKEADALSRGDEEKFLRMVQAAWPGTPFSKRETSNPTHLAPVSTLYP
jgi:hypothetical protein